ncbi:energy-coupling factor transporter transmembrane protein EcfT [Paradesulfitobacterium aromaticivorans]
MEIEVYWPGESVLHELDPRLKVGAFVWLSFVLTMVGWHGLAVASAGVFILMWLSEVPWRSFRPVLMVLLWIAAFYLLAGGWTWSESEHFWQGHFSVEGLKVAAVLVWRIAVLFALTRLFAAVTPPLEQGLGIAYFLNPLVRLTPKAADFALLITLTLRFMPLLLEEIAAISKARAAKGTVPSSLFGRIQELMNLLPALLLLSLRRAEETAENLVMRGYSSGKYRTLSTREWGRRDSWSVVAALLCGIILVILP